MQVNIRLRFMLRNKIILIKKFFTSPSVFNSHSLTPEKCLPALSSTRNTSLFYKKKVKVKYTFVQALRLCTGRTAHRGSRGIALLYRHWGSVQAVRPIGGVHACTRLTTHIVQFQLTQDTSRQQHGWILPDTVTTVKCSWWWAKTSPETCRAD
jgi:hypothetical protein